MCVCVLFELYLSRDETKSTENYLIDNLIFFTERRRARTDSNLLNDHRQ